MVNYSTSTPSNSSKPKIRMLYSRKWQMRFVQILLDLPVALTSGYTDMGFIRHRRSRLYAFPPRYLCRSQEIQVLLLVCFPRVCSPRCLDTRSERTFKRSGNSWG